MSWLLATKHNDARKLSFEAQQHNRHHTKRFLFNVISAITNQGPVRFMTYHETMTAKVLLRLFKLFIKGAKREVFLNFDNFRVHSAQLVRDWIKRHTDEIEVYGLPPYSFCCASPKYETA